MLSPGAGALAEAQCDRIRVDHILFITSIEHETLAPPDSGVQLFHSFSSYRRHLLHEEATRKENPIGPF